MDDRLLCKKQTLPEALLKRLPCPVMPAHPAGAPYEGCALSAPPVSGICTPDAPQIAMYTPGAESDETITLSGSGFGAGTLSAVAWGAGYNAPHGEFMQVQVLSHTDVSAAVCMTPFAPDTLYCLWLYNDQGASRPVWINRPSLWWINPCDAHPGDTIGLYGRELARQPDHTSTAVYLETANGTQRLTVTSCCAYAVEALLPADAPAGAGKIWVHTGDGGDYGWSDPVDITLQAQPCAPRSVALPDTDALHYDRVIDAALSALAPDESAELILPAGHFQLRKQLVLPGGVSLRGAGRDRTQLQFDLSGEGNATFLQAAYGHAITCEAGDAALTYQADIPRDGTYEVWIRYKASRDMPQGAQANLFKDPALVRVTAQEQSAQEHVYGTGFIQYPYWPYAHWARLGTLALHGGETVVSFAKSGALTLWLDAIVLSARPMPAPTAHTFPLPVNGADTVVLQANDYRTAEGCGRNHGDFGVPAVWLTGSHSHISGLTVSGDMHTDIGVAVGQPWDYPYDDHPTRDVSVRDLCIRNISRKDHHQPDGVYSEINHAGVFIRNGEGIRVLDNDICAQAPILFSGIRQGQVCGNTLCAKRGGNDSALGAIMSRRKPVNETVIAHNTIVSPKGAGGATCQRILWLATGQGSVCDNYIAHNRAAARFGGVACCDQNVGESFLFETGNGCAFYGQGAECTADTVRVNPDRLVWHVADEQNDGPEVIPTQHHVVVLHGKGLGQTRRVIAYDRASGTLTLDKPFLSIPDAQSTLVVTPLFYRNTVHANELADTMSGIQFWINGVENIVAENRMKNIRGTGIHIYAYFSRNEENQEPLYNAGVGMEYFNLIAENQIENTHDGIVVQSDSLPHVYGGFPLVLGNTVRCNTLRGQRRAGVVFSGFVPGTDMGRANVANTAEFNYTIDTGNAGVVLPACNDAAVIRRNHMYLWHKPDGEYQVVNAHEGAVNTYLDNNLFETRY